MFLTAIDLLVDPSLEDCRYTSTAYSNCVQTIYTGKFRVILMDQFPFQFEFQLFMPSMDGFIEWLFKYYDRKSYKLKVCVKLFSLIFRTIGWSACLLQDNFKLANETWPIYFLLWQSDALYQD